MLALAAVAVTLLVFTAIARVDVAEAGPAAGGAAGGVGAGVGRAHQGQSRGGELNGALAVSLLVVGVALAAARPGRTRLRLERQVLQFRAELEDPAVLPPR